MTKTRWTKEERQLLIDAYKNKLSKKETLASFPNRSYSAIKFQAKILKIKKIRLQYKNEDYFTVPNIKNSCISGILAADGCILPKVENAKDRNGNRVVIGFKTSDLVFLEQIKNEVGSNATINHIVRHEIIKTKRSKRNPIITYFSSITFSNAGKWIEDLKKNWNLIKKKSLILEPPNIADLDLKLAFLLGYINGDGTIGIQRTEGKEYLYITFLGTKNLLNWIKITLEDFLGEEIRADLRSHDNIFCFRVNGIQAIKIFNKMKSLDCLKLARKWDNPEVIAVANAQEMRNPQIFSQYFTQITPSPL